MARPRKAGLSYFPLDVDIFDADYKIIDLLERFGPKGFAVYIAVLCMVYREGYCLEIPMRSLQAQLGKMIGNRWLTDKTLVPDVISFCLLSFCTFLFTSITLLSFNISLTSFIFFSFFT